MFYNGNGFFIGGVCVSDNSFENGLVKGIFNYGLGYCCCNIVFLQIWVQ